MEQYPVAQSLILVLKVLLKQNYLHTCYNGGLSSYALTLLVVTFLRIHEKNGSNSVTSFSSNLDARAVGTLLVEFLWYFGTHKLQCVFTPGGETPILTPDFIVTEPQQHSRMIKVIDPLDETNDVTRACTRFQDVKELFFSSLKFFAGFHPSKYVSPLCSFIKPNDEEFQERMLRHPTLCSEPPVDRAIWQCGSSDGCKTTTITDTVTVEPELLLLCAAAKLQDGEETQHYALQYTNGNGCDSLSQSNDICYQNHDHDTQQQQNIEQESSDDDDDDDNVYDDEYYDDTYDDDDEVTEEVVGIEDVATANKILLTTDEIQCLPFHTTDAAVICDDVTGVDVAERSKGSAPPNELLYNTTK
jgi:DNA polymerase sigma